MAVVKMTKLITVRAPNLPLAPVEYQRVYHEQNNNALRLYFNRKDLNEAAILGPLGGVYFDAPYISASDSTDQYATADNTPTLVQWDSANEINGFTLNPGGTATVAEAGLYKIDFSLQFANTDNVSHDVFVWLQENGTVIPNSSSRFTLPARKSAGVFSYIVAYSSVDFPATPEDEIGLWWATEKAYNPVGPVDGIFMEALPAQTTPYVRPANPSAVGSITFLSRLP